MTTTEAERVRRLTQELTASATLRWGEQRAGELADAIASAAATLAELGRVELTADEAEPDFGR